MPAAGLVLMVRFPAGGPGGGRRGAGSVLPALRAALPLPPPGDAPHQLPQRRALALPVPDLRVPRQYLLVHSVT